MAEGQRNDNGDAKGNFRFSVEGTEYEIGRLTLIDLVGCAEHLRKEKRKVYDDALALFAKIGAEAGDLAKDAFRMRADDVMLDPEEFFGWIKSPEGIVHLLRVGIDKCLDPSAYLPEGSVYVDGAREKYIDNIIAGIGVDIINQWQMFIAQSFATDRWEGVHDAAERLMEMIGEIPEELHRDLLAVVGFVQGT